MMPLLLHLLLTQCVVFIVLTTLLAASSSTSGLVHVLTEDTFTAFIEENPVVLVEFYAPWCGHCKQLAPHFAQAASMLAVDSIPLGSVDCISQQGLYWSNNIKGYPTLLAFLGAEPVLYDGPRDAAAIASFMRKMKIPVLVPLHSAKDIARLASSHRTVARPVALVFVGAEGGAVADRAEQALDLVCKKLDAFVCGVVREADDVTATMFGVAALPGYAVLPALAEELPRGQRAVALPASPSGALPSLAELRLWLLRRGYPAAVAFKEQHMELMFSDRRPGFQVHVLLVLPPSALGGQRAPAWAVTLQAFREQGHRFAGRCVFIWVDSAVALQKEGEGEGEGEGGGAGTFTLNLLSDLGVEASSLVAPRLMAIRSARTRIEFFEQAQTEAEQLQGGLLGEGVGRFVEGVLAGDERPVRVVQVPAAS